MSRPLLPIVRVALVLPAAASLVLLAVGCTREEGDARATEDVVVSVPFGPGDEARYVLRDTKGRDRGSGVLRVEAEAGAMKLVLRFENQGHSDETAVTVDPRTLAPHSVHREVRSDGDQQVIDASYGDDTVQITQRTDGRERSSPLRLKPNSYDNDSSLFLWRTIAFRDDYEARYHTVITNRRSIEPVTLRIIGRETVDVPAGRFEDAWKLEIRSGGVTQTAWFADRPDHVLVKYDNNAPSDRLIFVLTQAPQ